MTLAMPDSIYPSRLPPGCPAYLGYVDGRWATAPALRVLFPGAHILTLTVIGGDAIADGCDCETYDLTVDGAIKWTAGRLAVGQVRPVIYASVSTMANAILPGLTAAGISRFKVRLLSAHYGKGVHICGPHTCGMADVDMDGTQWTDAYSWPGGLVDMSLLADDFFGAPVPVQTTEVDVTKIPIVKLGDSGQAVKNWQGLLVSHGYGFIIANPAGHDVMERAGVDGVFGPLTHQATVRFQGGRNLTIDGIVGPQTWTAGLITPHA